MCAITRNVTESLAALLLAGCASYEHPVAPLDATARSAVGPLSVETAMVAPVVPASPPPTHGRGIAALKGAGGSLLVGMAAGAETRDGFGFILGTALGVVAAPFVAVGAAIAAPATTDVQQSAGAIRAAITGIQWDRALNDAVEKALARQGRAIATPPPADASRLKLTVEGPWLVLDSYTAVPTLTVHGELARQGACLADRRWRWNGDADHFVDLGEDRAKDYRAQMEHGLAMLAEAAVADLLVSAAPRPTPYEDEAAAQRGGLPLLATNPMDFQEQIGAWDKSAAEAAREPRCAGILNSAPEPAAPPDHACRGFGCRNV
jgi:hypothetical protein